MGLRIQKTYSVPFYQADFTGYMTVSALLSVALQFAGEQSMQLGRSDDWLARHYGLIWIVTEYALDLTRLPRFKETLTVETEARTYNKFFCYRDFVFKTKSGEVLVDIHSTWMLMDKETRKIARVGDEIVAPYEVEQISRIEQGHLFHTLEDPIFQRYLIRNSDIDLNQHVNNSVYINWALDVLSLDFLKTHRPRKIFIRYNHEVRYGTDITSFMSQEARTTYHRINDNDAQIEIIWEKSSETEVSKKD